MLDLEAASALLDVAHTTGAGVALVGDEQQALPVGHSGAMALFWRRSPQRVELSTTHRFKDPEWAELALRLRDPIDKAAMIDVAAAIVRTEHVVMAESDIAARAAMVEAWFEAAHDRETISLVTATHTEAQEVGEAIQARRIASGAISVGRAFSGQAGQTIFVGDVVQSRRNDSVANVQNRQNWIVKTIGEDGVILAASTDTTDLRSVSLAYAESHVHLSYATTVYGVQGETTDRSLVGPGVDAAGLYVGLTRGKQQNSVVLVAPTQDAARSELVELMQRRTVEETIEKSRAAARSDLRRAARPAAGPVVEGRVRRPASVGIE